jgi:(2Fe-2S) ferredoxin
MSSSGLNEATKKVFAGIEDPEVAERYPNRAHFIAADNPQHGQMATRALFGGDPVVLVYPDGHELLMTPELARGIAALLLILAAAVMRLRSRKAPNNVVQFPPRTRIEARDSAGLPIAA